jgi:hypothetical protein
MCHHPPVTNWPKALIAQDAEFEKKMANKSHKDQGKKKLSEA